MAGMDGIQGFDPDEDFYEDDEPVEDVQAAFDAGEKFTTAPPAVMLDTHGLTVAATSVGVQAVVRSQVRRSLYFTQRDMGDLSAAARGPAPLAKRLIRRKVMRSAFRFFR